MYEFLKAYNIKVCVIATKMDKLKNSELVKNKKVGGKTPKIRRTYL